MLYSTCPNGTSHPLLSVRLSPLLAPLVHPLLRRLTPRRIAAILVPLSLGRPGLHPAHDETRHGQRSLLVRLRDRHHRHWDAIFGHLDAVTIDVVLALPRRYQPVAVTESRASYQRGPREETEMDLGDMGALERAQGYPALVRLVERVSLLVDGDDRLGLLPFRAYWAPRPANLRRTDDEDPVAAEERVSGAEPQRCVAGTTSRQRNACPTETSRVSYHSSSESYLGWWSDLSDAWRIVPSTSEGNGFPKALERSILCGLDSSSSTSSRMKLVVAWRRFASMR